MPIPLITPAAYAETHYRIPFLFSYLKKKQPEILADIPHRLEPGRDLPVLILLKDADTFPVTLDRVSIFIDTVPFKHFQIHESIRSTLFERILFVNLSDLKPGLHHVDIRIDYTMRGRNRSCFNDNYRTTGKKPFPLLLSSTPTPCFEGYIAGEMHAHTEYTSDQIEFAASIRTNAVMARAMGLRFYCATDHSYDLDDEDGDYSRNDPDLKKWRRFNHEIIEFNRGTEGFCIIPGEEVSARSKRGRNLHLLVYNSDRFFPGSGDSGDRWFYRHSEHSIDEISRSLDGESLAVAAHPVDKVPWIQRLLLGRAEWRLEDIGYASLRFVQIINGSHEKQRKSEIAFWTRLLLEGQRVYGLAGNDAHGNFGRYRQMGLPFLTIRESYDQLFGAWRTVVYHPQADLSPGSLIKRIREGNSYMTNGPALQLRLLSGGREIPMGGVTDHADTIIAEALSSPDMGSGLHIRVLRGETGTKQERLLFERLTEDHSFQSTIQEQLPAHDCNVYYRAELIVRGKNGTFFAYTNPVWVELNNI